MQRIQKKVIESSTFDLLITYSGFILGIFNSYFIARLISPEDWGLLLMVLNIIKTIAFICNIFPPGAEGSLSYYIPSFKNKTENSNIEIRGFILHVLKIRFLSFLITFISFIIIINILGIGNILIILLFLLSPTLLFNTLQPLIIAIIRSNLKFKIAFYINSLNIIIYTTINFVIFVSNLKNPLFFIALASLVSGAISFILSIILVFPIIPKENSNKMKIIKFELKKYYKIHTEYGLHIILSGLIIQITTLLVNFIFLSYDAIVYITYLSISTNLVSQVMSFSGSNRVSMVPIFTELDYKNNPETYKKILYQITKYLILFLSIIVVALFYFMELFILIIYSEIYLVILTAVKISLFRAFMKLIIRNLLIISHSTNNTKINSELNLIDMIMTIIITLISLTFFNFTTLILLLLFESIILTFIMIILVNKQVDIKLKLFNLFKPFLLFLLVFSFSYPISLLINFQFFDVNFFNLFLNSFIKVLIFLIMLYIVNYITKFITREEYSQLEKLIPILSSKKKFINNISTFIKKLLPTQTPK